MKFYDGFPPPSKPRKAKGGIKARSKRGDFGTQWWAKRWLAVLEKMDLGARLKRGRSYARAGQVLDIAIAPGVVTARVQGSRATPYKVTIRVHMLGKPAWRKVAEHIATEARFAAKLLAGEIPQDIEEAFKATGTSLFPTTIGELHTECSCPDWSNPCKHVAAAYYLIGEEFDRDPFLLFTLRGTTKADLLADLHSEEKPAPKPSAKPVALQADIASFWGRAASGIATGEKPAPSERAASTPLPRALPAFAFWRGTESLEDTLAEVDERATAAALALLSTAAEAD